VIDLMKDGCPYLSGQGKFISPAVDPQTLISQKNYLLRQNNTGDGVVVMTNSDVGLAVGNVLLKRIAEVYGWDYVAPPPP